MVITSFIFLLISFEGHGIFLQSDGEFTELELYLQSDPRGNIPLYMINLVWKDIFRGIRRYKEILENGASDINK
jgi:hypothetical protein